jgi:hypothetical protein
VRSIDAPRVSLGGRFHRRFGEIAQNAHPALAQDAVGCFYDCGLHVDNLALGVPQGAVRVGEVAFFQEAATVTGEKQVLGPAGVALQCVFKLLADNRPGLGPGLGARPPETGWVFGLAEDWLPCVVVAHDEIGAPPNHHRKARCEAGCDGCFEGVGPALGWA